MRNIRTAVCLQSHGARDAAAAANPAASAIHRSRLLFTLVVYSRRPWAIASMGGTKAASRAGEYAEATATPTPTSKASNTESGVNAIAPGRLLTYNASTVSPINCTAPLAMSRPNGSPTSAPRKPKHAASPTNAARTRVRLAPSARTIPISARRRTTETENCVVDQECADNQRDITEQSQIPTKRPQHTAIFICSRAGRAHLYTFGVAPVEAGASNPPR